MSQNKTYIRHQTEGRSKKIVDGSSKPHESSAHIRLWKARRTLRPTKVLSLNDFNKHNQAGATVKHPKVAFPTSPNCYNTIEFIYCRKPVFPYQGERNTARAV